MRTQGFLRKGALVALAAATGLPALAAGSVTDIDRNARVERSAPVTPVPFNGDVRDLPSPAGWRPGEPVREIPRRAYPRPGSLPVPPYETGMDPLAERQRAAAVQRGGGSFTTPSRNFEGLPFSGVNPPDTVGDVGPSHYIQSTNTGAGSIIRIFDKAEPTPNQLAEFSMDSLATGACTSGFSDPIVLYDRHADRWFLSEFATGGNTLCLYVSQTGDPVSGGWNFYEFVTPSFPDYPKYGVWPTDANGGMGSYVATANESSPSVLAFDRGAMLAGDPATFQRFTLTDLSGFGFQTATPADLDGPNLPPATSPAVIMRHRDTENHSGPAVAGDVLELFLFDIDWQTAANTTLTQAPDILVAEFDSDLCGLTAFFCFPQPDSGTTLDPLREVIMNRLQYINLGDHETVVGNFVTDVDGNDLGGLRWFELRRNGGDWELFQEGTYSPDGDSRFMAASAMDQSGNIAIAYNVTSSTTFPSLRYTGRMAEDAAGVMTQAETVIHPGASPNSSNRYGDYSSMNLDPSDDCTFWFTGMDNVTTSWRTQIASFRFEACGCELAPLPLVLAGGNNGDNRVDLSWGDSELETVVEYRIRRALSADGPFATIGTVADVSPGVGNAGSYDFSDTTVSGNITYYYEVIASDGAACRSPSSNQVVVTATGACLLEPEFDGVQSVSTPNSGVCTLDVEWDPAVAPCGGPVTYDVFRSTDAAFQPGQANLVASDISGTTFTDLDGLENGETYSYVARARDTGNGVQELNTNRVSGIPAGVIGGGTGPTFVDDAGDTGAAQLTADAPWTIAASGGNFGPGVYQLSNYDDDLCAALTTPPIVIAAGDLLEFWSRFDIEPNWDKGIVEISIDGGSNWETVPVDYPGNASQTADACGYPTGPAFTGSGETWTLYSGDLGAWAGNEALLRFRFSTDGSVNRATGWLIDDISVSTGVGECATGSSCDDNPIIDVVPNGNLLECEGLTPELSVVLSGGNGPFEYQWIEDGEIVPDATEATFQPTSLGTHSYNVRVRALTCPDEVFDGNDTLITIENTPRFDGLETAVDAQSDTCGVQLDWDDATSACPGPLTYDLYRSESPSVAAVPEDLLLSGLTDSEYFDQAGIENGTPYYYLVRTVDQFNLRSDANSVVKSATPTGPNSGLTRFLDEDFEDARAFSDFTVTTGPGPHNCGAFERRTVAGARPSGGSGGYAGSISDPGLAGDCTLLPLTSSTLFSPVLDFTTGGTLVQATLEFDLFYNDDDGDETARIEVFDGAIWVELWASTGADFNGNLSFDVTAIATGNSAFQVRWDYQDANSDGWLTVDDVIVEALIENSCATGLTGPPPAGDGRGGSDPLRADRLSPSSVAVSWDAGCGATDYNLLYGSLSNVATVQLDGSVCDLGTTGAFTWNGTPAGDLFFLIVGDDGAGTESSWGLGTGGERNGADPSGECGASDKDTTGSCF